MEPVPLFKIENLTYYYPDAPRPAPQNINLVIEDGEYLLVVCGSGSGKYSLASILAGKEAVLVPREGG